MVDGQLGNEMELNFIKKNQIDKVIKSNKLNNLNKALIISNICRLNILFMIKNAGSGHLGTSMSSVDIMVWLKLFHMKKKKLNDPNRDIFFSSKGHDAPALYSVLFARGDISLKKITKLRKIDGLDGHPDVSCRGVEANTGSLGMGISKAKGILWSKKYLGYKGFVYVMTGDGELQEGQIFEALQTTKHQQLNDILVIVDHNKIQSSKFVREIVDLNNLKYKFSSFGWHFERCNGHSFSELNKTLLKLNKVKHKPKILVADTIKGKGISFMEHTNYMKKNKFYTWHAGAPSDEDFLKAQEEIINLIKIYNKKFNLIIKISKIFKEEISKSFEIH